MNASASTSSQSSSQTGSIAPASLSNQSPVSSSCQSNPMTPQSNSQLSQSNPPPLQAQLPPSQPTKTDREKIYQWIIELASPESRENSLLELRYSIIMY